MMMMSRSCVSRSWILVDKKGQSAVLDLDKYEIMKLVPIHTRDLRILDPLLSYPSAILGRDRVIVLNLEHIKAIITTEEVLLRDPLDDNVIPIVEELQRRLPLAAASQAEGDDGGGVDRRPGPGIRNNGQETDTEQTVYENAEFPFEFHALEVALEGICSSLDTQTRDLETAAYPALDELTAKISSLNLDRVRKLKTAMTRLTSRVQKVRDELEQLLDEDDDMGDMYLSRKLVANTLSSPPMSCDVVSSDDCSFHAHSPTNLSSMPSHGYREEVVHHNVEELEMLLEAYFVQIESTMNKLTTLREYIDDTEDYINIQLDHHRNQLIQELHACMRSWSCSSAQVQCV